MKELTQRFIFGLIAIVLLVVGIALSPYPWFRPIVGIAIAGVASVGLWEYYRMSRRRGFRPAASVGIVFACIYIFAHYSCTFETDQSFVQDHLAGFVFGVTMLAFSIQFMARPQGVLANFAISTFGFLYVVIPLGMAFDILYCSPVATTFGGQWWISYIIVVTVATDVGAYFTGKLIGRHKMAPKISPGKTWEGGVGGVILGVIVAMCAYLFSGGELPFWGAVVFGVVLAVVGQIGDLVESLFKRDSELKDSNTLPGLGGVLDVVDSLLFNFPLGYLIIRVLHQ